MDAHVRWLRDTNQSIYEVGESYWRVYQRALVPASLNPQPLTLEMDQAEHLLKRSGALFLRYFSQTFERPTDFWYVACNQYRFDDLASKTRTQIRKAHKDCRIERVDPTWLAENGYPCYISAFSRYQNAKPESQRQFNKMCIGAIGGPFEFWAAFVGSKLAGFTKCAVAEDWVASQMVKLDPSYMSLNPSSALVDSVLNTYVMRQRKTVFAWISECSTRNQCTGIPVQIRISSSVL